MRYCQLLEKGVVAGRFRSSAVVRIGGISWRCVTSIRILFSIASIALVLFANPTNNVAFGRTMIEAAANGMAGDWQGELAVGNAVLPLILHLKESSGTWQATIDSPAQGATGLRVDDVAVAGNSFRLQLTMLRAVFEGRMSAVDHLSGTWSQGGKSLPLEMTRLRSAQLDTGNHLDRSFYRSEQVSFDNAAGGSHIAGTLTVPVGAGPFPAALLISGSGLQDRDETIFGHKPFLVWADYLSRRGIAVLRVDDREVGGSTGEVRNATTVDFAGDAAAGFAYLKRRKEIDGRRIGLVGHSEGAMIAALVASMRHDVRFVVMLAGVGLSGRELLLDQRRNAEMRAGYSPEAVAESESNMRKLFDAVSTATDQPSAEASLLEAWKEVIGEEGGRVDAPPTEIASIATPWMRWFLGYDPAKTLSLVRCPVLAVAGSKDVQVEPLANLAGIRTGLRSNPSITTRLLPHLNHLFQRAETGAIEEYASIPESVSPEALSIVGEWISTQTHT